MQMRDLIATATARHMPFWLQAQAKRLGLYRLLAVFYDKSGAELVFQQQWAVEFKEHRDGVLKYWRTYRQFDRICGHVDLTPASRVLDVGCGISSVLHFLPGLRVGIDPLAGAYHRLYDYPSDLDIFPGSGEAIPFAGESFDAVWCTNVLDHVSDPAQTVNEIRRVLKPGGHLVLTVESFGTPTSRDPAHPHALTAAACRSLLARGFEIQFEHLAPWIGLRNYRHGVRRGDHDELSLVVIKR